mmetsp:Transcript_1925/g.3935  ORF Transcript_1925/g.3935 Transcript_1925/m.3935 type:complete len:207 (+) Transcript_1925:5236-5856(+)
MFDKGTQNLGVPAIAPTQVRHQKQHLWHVKPQSLKRIQLFHALMSKVSPRLAKHVVPMASQTPQDVHDTIIDRSGLRACDKSTNQGFVRRQTMVETEFIGLVTPIRGPVLGIVGQFKVVGLGCQVLRNRVGVVRHQSFTTTGQDPRHPVAFSEHDAKDGSQGMIACSRKVLRGRKASYPNHWNLAPPVHETIVGHPRVNVPKPIVS